MAGQRAEKQNIAPGGGMIHVAKKGERPLSGPLTPEKNSPVAGGDF
jgi:hypothetical protein